MGVRYQGVTGKGWCAASGRVCCRFWFSKVTEKYVEHLESGTARREERGAAGKNGRGGPEDD